MLCPASLVLPRFEQRSKKTDEAADYGTLVHWWKETGETRPKWASASDIRLLEEKIELTGVNRQRLWVPADRSEHEVSFAIEVATSREYVGRGKGDTGLAIWKGLRADAEKWKAKFDRRRFLTGTIDWLVWGAAPWVDDLKTGKWPVAPDCRQIKSYALVPWLSAGAPADMVVLTSVTQWPKYPKWKNPTRKWHELSALDLAEHLDDLHHALTHPEEANPEPLDEGPFDPAKKLSVCAFCPCRPPLAGSEWLHNYRYRAEQHCTPGLIKRLNGRR